MKQPDLEVDIRMDRDLLTEERFSFRKWLQKFILVTNSEEPRGFENFFSENFEAFGFKDTRQNKEEFVEYFGIAKNEKVLRWFKFSELGMKKKNDVYFVKGYLEAYSDEVLMLEGAVEMQVMENKLSNEEDDDKQEKFVFIFFTLGPRMRVSF